MGSSKTYIIHVSLFHNCLANLNLCISHQDRVSIHLFNIRYHSHRSSIVLILSSNGLVILSIKFAAFQDCSLNVSKTSIISFIGFFCRFRILYLNFESDLPDGSQVFFWFHKVKKTFKLSFFNFVHLQSGQVFISNIAWKSTVNSHFTY